MNTKLGIHAYIKLVIHKVRAYRLDTAITLPKVLINIRGIFMPQWNSSLNVLPRLFIHI